MEIKMFLQDKIHTNDVNEITDIIFYVAFVMYWLLSILWTSTAISLLTSRTYIIGIAIVMMLLLIREVICFWGIRKYKRREIIGFLIVAVLGYIVDCDETATIAAGYLVIFAAREMDYKKIFRVAILSTIAGVIMVYAMAKLGLITDATWTEGTHIRYAFGFVYPLVIPAYFLNIGMMTFAIKEDKIAIWQILILLLGTICTYVWCKADLSCGLMIVLIIAMITVKINPDIIRTQGFFQKWIDRLTVVIYPMAALLSYIIA